MNESRRHELSSRPLIKPLSIQTLDHNDDELHNYLDKHFVGASSATSSLSNFSNFSSEFQPPFGMSPQHAGESSNIRFSWSNIPSDLRSTSSDTMSVNSAGSSAVLNGSSKNLNRSGRLNLDPIEISPSSSASKGRSTSIQTAAISVSSSSFKSDIPLSPRDCNLSSPPWNDVSNNKSTETMLPSSPSNSSWSGTDTTPNTQSRISSFFSLPGYKGNNASTPDSKSSVGSGPNNRLPPMSKSMSNIFHGRKAISEPARMLTPQQMQQQMQQKLQRQQQSPTTKPRPNISERMSSLISIFSRSDTGDFSSIESPSASISGPRRASSSYRSTRPTRLTEQGPSSSAAVAATLAATTNAMTSEFMVRNLDTGQVIDLDRLASDVPTTIHPDLLLVKKGGNSKPSSTTGSVRSQSVSSKRRHGKKTDYPPALPPLFKDVAGGTATKGYVIRTL